MILPLRKTVWQILLNLSILPCDPVIALLGICPIKFEILCQHSEKQHSNVCISFICNCTNRKHQGCPSIDEWINKLWNTYTMGYYASIKRNEYPATKICMNLIWILLRGKLVFKKGYIINGSIYMTQNHKTIEIVYRSLVPRDLRWGSESG